LRAQIVDHRDGSLDEVPETALVTLGRNGSRRASATPILSSTRQASAGIACGTECEEGLPHGMEVSGGTGDLSFTNTASVSLSSTSRTFNVLNTTTFANGFSSNSGSIIKTGAGTLIFTGASTYGGGTTINAGTLQLGNGLSSGSLNATSTITNNGTLVFNRNNTANQGVAFGAVIAGSGNVIQDGSGTLVLNGVNTYSGGTTLNTGTLTIANTAAAGSGTITQTNGTSLLKIDTTGTIANAMSVYNVLANKTVTLSGGITVNNAVLDVASGETLTISNTVNGTGGLTKNGTGTFDHIAFAGTDAPGMAKHFASKNVPFRERTVPSLNLHQIFLDDPSGVVIELNYPAGEPVAA
jgi:autotransporter-associated beta strand protein